jgi:hypothetical protein
MAPMDNKCSNRSYPQRYWKLPEKAARQGSVPTGDLILGSHRMPHSQRGTLWSHGGPDSPTYQTWVNAVLAP